MHFSIYKKEEAILGFYNFYYYLTNEYLTIASDV